MDGYGARSPPPPDVSSPFVKFDTETLSAYMKKLLSMTLADQPYYSSRDRDRSKAWCKEISERVKERMLEIQPSGFKYIVTTRIDEILGQGGCSNLICHWEDCDTVIKEVYNNPLLSEQLKQECTTLV